MFILRSVGTNDLDSLYELSKLVSFINLPADQDMISQKIKCSIETFEKPGPNLEKNNYFFVLENLDDNKVVGVCMIHAQHGSKETPHFYLKVGKEEKYSQTINTGHVHGTLKLGQNTTGLTEIGSLVLHPQFRGHPQKLGKKLSYVRFLYMALFPERFMEMVHCELMPPLDKDGNSALWEAIGRKFMNMDYQDADRLSLTNKEFILSLFPKETIYVPLLPIEARDAIGRVGRDTLPVKKMLESIGFKFTNEVDPFDGGPHYRCLLEDITLIRDKKKVSVEVVKELKDALNKKEVLMTIPHPDHTFCAIWAEIEDRNDQAILSAPCLDKIDLPNSFTSDLIFIGEAK